MSITPDRNAWLKGGDCCCSKPPETPRRPYRLVLLGAPGVGKGTQAELLQKRLGACWLSTGDIFRSARCRPECELSPAMREALDAMRRGELVSDGTVLTLVAERAHCLYCGGGFLLDGFPRTLSQAEALLRLLARSEVELDAVIHFELPLDQIIARLSGRRTCANCRVVFHVGTRPPRTLGVCDHCGGELRQREDDRPESIRVRMAAYEENARPLADFFQNLGLLITVPANGSPEEIHERTMDFLHALA